MKKLYIAIFFLAVSIGLCVTEQYIVENTYKQSTAYIDSALESINADDFEKAHQSCVELADYWNSKYPYMTAMIDHNSIDDTNVTVNSVSELTEKESDELQSQLITAKNQIKTIRDNQRITLGNIF